MISAIIREIEEPLITGEELAQELGITPPILKDTVLKLGIKPYKIKKGNVYVNAYNEEMVLKIIEKRSAIQGFIRKNKLDVRNLL